VYTSVQLRDFRSISHADLALGRLTILVGPNGAGRSNILRAVEIPGTAASRLGESPERGAYQVSKTRLHEVEGKLRPPLFKTTDAKFDTSSATAEIDGGIGLLAGMVQEFGRLHLTFVPSSQKPTDANSVEYKLTSSSEFLGPEYLHSFLGAASSVWSLPTDRMLWGHLTERQAYQSPDNPRGWNDLARALDSLVLLIPLNLIPSEPLR
jgi:hypothetical protein